MLAAKIRNYRTGVVHKDTTGEGVFGMYPLTMSKLSEPAIKIFLQLQFSSNRQLGDCGLCSQESLLKN